MLQIFHAFLLVIYVLCILSIFASIFQRISGIFQFFLDGIFFGLASGHTERSFKNEPDLRNVGTKRNYW